MTRLLGLAALLSVAAAPMHYADFRAQVVQPPAPRTIRYAAGPLQQVELWKPPGAGLAPVVLMLHGGCWQSDVAKADIMHALAADLVAHGIAVWNVEYRGVDVPGGGYPGTFADVAAAADLLAREGGRLGLDTRRVVAVGHSAGGHLALWLAARPKIARNSALWSAHPLPIAGVVSLGGLPDLALAKRDATEACGVDTVDRLVGPSTAAHRDPYADTSPDHLLPIGVPQTLVTGGSDPIAPPAFADDWTGKARASGDAVVSIVVPDQGHFELIAPGTPAWTQARRAIVAMLGAQPRPR